MPLGFMFCGRSILLPYNQGQPLPSQLGSRDIFRWLLFPFTDQIDVFSLAPSSCQSENISVGHQVSGCILHLTLERENIPVPLGLEMTPGVHQSC